MSYQKREKSLVTWNKEFETGHWTEVFGMERELPRYFSLRGYIHNANPNPEILDLGCGQGTIIEHLHTFKKYTGVDFSSEALRIASKFEAENVVFFQHDIQNFEPSSSADIILFNECLIYFDHPLDIMSRYEPFLKKNGVFIVSNHVREASDYIWRQIDLKTNYSIDHQVKLTAGNESWIIKVLSLNK